MSEPEINALADLLQGVKGSGYSVFLVILHSPTNIQSGEVYPGYTAAGIHTASDRITQMAGTILGYTYRSEWDDYEITGELINWAADRGIPSVDILWPVGSRPSGRDFSKLLAAIAE
jgi:hypothetical protein